MTTLTQFPKTPFLDQNGYPTQPWIRWMQNPQFVTATFGNGIGISSGGTGSSQQPGAYSIPFANSSASAYTYDNTFTYNGATYTLNAQNASFSGTVSAQTANVSGTVSAQTANVSGTVSAGSISSANTFGFKNRLINGAFNIWQRGTSTSTNGAYLADRWYGYSSSGIISWSQASSVPAGFQYSASFTCTGGGLTQRIESANCADLAGQSVTVSFWADNTSGSDNLQVECVYPNAADNWTSQTVIGSQIVSASPGGWQRYSATFSSLPSGVANGLGVFIYRGSSASSTTLVTGVQLELGNQSTSFDVRPYGTELQLCQRYYETGYGFAGSRYSDYYALAYLSFKVTKRTSPTMVVSPSTGISYMNTDSAGAYEYSASTQTYFPTWSASAEL